MTPPPDERTLGVVPHSPGGPCMSVSLRVRADRMAVSCGSLCVGNRSPGFDRMYAITRSAI